MKRKLLLAGLIPLMLVTTTPRAQALNPEWAAVLGAVGGFYLADRFAGPSTCYAAEPEGLTLQDAYYTRHYPSSYFASSPRSGHYEIIVRQTWVPGRYIYTRTGCNRYRRHWNEGYYQTAQVRIWVRD